MTDLDKLKVHNKECSRYLTKNIPTFVLSAQSSLQTPVNCNFWIFCVLNPDLHPPFGYGSRRSPIMGIWIQKVYHNNADSKHRFCCICEPRKTS